MKIVTLENLRHFKSLIMTYVNRPDDELQLNNEWLQMVYPIGAVYISSLPITPSELFGFGTWEQIKDTFLLCAGDNYSAGSTGGESEHVLTIEEMPSHTHTFDHNVLVDTTADNGFTVGQATNKQHTIIDSINSMQATGGNQPHNNMPPYLTVYAWKRVA